MQSLKFRKLKRCESRCLFEIIVYIAIRTRNFLCDNIHKYIMCMYRSQLTFVAQKF